MKILLAAAAVLVLATAPALAEDLNFTLNNTSSSPVNGFYVSHVGTNSWEDNLMEGRTLASGGSVSVLIADGRTTCEYDIKVTFEDGSSTDERGLNLCEMGSYTVSDAN